MTDLITVIEADSYLAKARKLMTEAERERVVAMVATSPDAAPVIPGTGGLRKLRIPLGGQGKRGGGRVIYWYHSSGYPTALLWVFAKNKASDLTKEQYRQLSRAMDDLVRDYGEG